MLFARKKAEMVAQDQALPGRTDQTMPVPTEHFINGHPLTPPWPTGYQTAVFGLGCFWGAERKFWETPGVWTTAVGLAGCSYARTWSDFTWVETITVPLFLFSATF